MGSHLSYTIPLHMFIIAIFSVLIPRSCAVDVNLERLRRAGHLDDDKAVDTLGQEAVATFLNLLITASAETFAESFAKYRFECPEAEGVFGDPLDCALYYKCLNWEHTDLRCESGLAFSEAQQKCITWKDADCIMGPLDEKHKCLTNGTEPDPNNCGGFYVCVGDRAFTKSCDEGLKFDKNLRMCLGTDSVKCASADADTVVARRIA